MKQAGLFFLHFGKENSSAGYMCVPIQILDQEFPFHLIFLPEFPVEWFTFQRFIYNFSRKFLDQLHHSWMFQLILWLKGKSLDSLSAFQQIYVVHSDHHLMTSVYHTCTKQLFDEVFVMTLTKTLIIPDGYHKTKSNLIVLLHIERKKKGGHVFASSPIASNTKHVNLTWLPLKGMHCDHTWHDYPWPWVSLTPLLYNLQLDDAICTDFQNSLYAFSLSEKRY